MDNNLKFSNCLYFHLTEENYELVESIRLMCRECDCELGVEYNVNPCRLGLKKQDFFQKGKYEL